MIKYSKEYPTSTYVFITPVKKTMTTVGKFVIKKHSTELLGIYNVFIFPEYRNLGLGTKMFKQLINKFKHKELRLRVYKTNKPAIKLYLKSGFVIDRESSLGDTFLMIRKKED